MTRWSAITRTRGRRSALAYGSRSTTAAEDNLNRLVHHQRGRYSAACFSVSPATAHRWWHRWLDASEEARASLSCLLDRSSRPHRSPRQLAPELAERICACRRKTGWGPRLVAAATGFAHSTVWKALKRAGISRPPKPTRQPANRYEWPCPGDLLHMDTSEYARFQRPGHRLTGDRRSQDRQHRDGIDIVHAIVDDHSRLAYAEIHDDQRAMAREWAYGLVYDSHRERAAALPHWLHHYNTARPYSSLGDRPPTSRVHNVRGQDI
jgi:transposase